MISAHFELRAFAISAFGILIDDMALERINSLMLVFGVVPADFRQVEAPKLPTTGY